MKTCFVACVILGTAISLSAREGPRLGVAKKNGDVAISITGGSGLAQLQEKDDIGPGDFKKSGELTTETNITRSAAAQKKFFRAQTAPANDVSIFRNTLSMLDSGRDR